MMKSEFCQLSHPDPVSPNDTDVPVSWGSTVKVQLFAPGSPFTGKMAGSEVNHDTIPWYVYENATSELK
jgi:hypothetical protein